MAQSTEDYLDSLLRQAMGVPEPEPEKKPDEIQNLDREDVFAMAEGLTGSNSAILGNAYDQNASFTNRGEIEIPVEPKAVAAPEPEPVQIPADLMPDVDAPVPDSGEISEPILPQIEPDMQENPVEPETIVEPETSVAAEIPVAEQIPLPEGPVIEHDGNLDIIPEPVIEEIEVPVPEPVIEEPVIEEPAIEEPVIEEPVIEEPAIEEPVIEEPVIEEPVIEEPVIEEPVIEEPVIEEPAIEEPVIEEPAIEEPVIEEPVIEEPVIEEPVIEEPVIEEPVIEEPVIEEPVIEEPVIEEPVIEEPVIEEPAVEEPTGMSIDDLDPNDSMKALDADTIAALFAGANTDDLPAVEEETAAEPEAEAETEPELEAEAESEPAMEELSMPEDEDEEAPLMPDQEISELLSSLGELTGENAGEEESEESPTEAPADEAAAEESSEEEAPVEEASEEVPADDLSGEDISAEETPNEEEASASDNDLGIDMFDTDLSAMLDDVTDSLSSEEGENGAEAEAANADDQDLNDLLGSLDDGSGDLSDIGNLLEKDENSELVDPNTETAEALFASDSEDELFNIDNLIDEEEESSGKKKKRGLFGRKKKKGDNVEVIGEDEELLVDPDLLDIPDESEVRPKKKGFFANLFAKLFEEVEDEEPQGASIEQSAVDIAQEGAAENEAILSELGEEGAGEDKKKKKEKKKKEKKGKKGSDAEGEEGEEGAQEEKKKKKKEKKKKVKDDLPEIPGKRLPRKKVVAISLFCITIGLVITFTAFLYPYSQDIKKAKKFYTTGEYQKTYEYMRGHKLTKEDQVLYDRTVTLLRVKRPYDSYQNYMKMGLRMEALNALVQGVQMIDEYAEEAATLGIIDKYSVQSRQIYDELYNTFGVTVDSARSWIELEGSPEYTRALYDALRGTSQAAGGVAPDEGAAPAEGGQDVLPPGAPDNLQPEDDSVINAEENDL